MQPHTPEPSPVIRALTIGAIASVALRRWPIVVIVAMVVGFLFYQFLSRSDPLYRAEASVSFHSPATEGAANTAPTIGFLNTAREEMLSIPRLEGVVASLDLVNQKPYRSVQDPVALLRYRLSSETNKDAWIIRVKLVDEFPERAQALLDQIIESYTQSTSSSSEGRRSRIRGYWDQQIQSMQSELEERKQALDQLRRDEVIISDDPSNNHHTRELDELRQQWSQALADYTQREKALKRSAVIDQVVTDGDQNIASWADPLSEIVELPGGDVVEQFWEAWIESRNNRKGLEVLYGPKHPIMKDALQTEAERMSQLSALAQSVRARAATQVATLKADVDLLASKIADTEGAVAAYRQHLVELELVNQDIANRQIALDRLQDRMRELEIAELVNDGGIHIVSPTRVESKPYNVNQRLMILLSTFVGFVAGGAAAVLLELTNRYVRTQEVEEETRLTTFTRIPIVRSLKMGFELRTLLDEPALHEPFRLLTAATTLNVRTYPDRGTMIGVTSPVESDGKTLTATMLAITLAQAGKRVLLIDADFRRSKLDAIFGIDSTEPGLSYLLTSTDEISPFVSGVENLDVLPTGPIPPNPIALIHDERFSEVLSSCADFYEYVIVDTPPAALVSDAAVIGRRLDAMLVVVRDRRTPRAMLQTALATLAPARSILAGVVVNGDHSAQIKNIRRLKN